MIVSSREPRELHSFPTRRSSDLSSASVRFSVSSRAENVAATRSACSGNRRSTSSAPRAVVVTLTARRSVLRRARVTRDRKSTRLNSSHLGSSYAVFCLKKKRDQNALHLRQGHPQQDECGRARRHRVRQLRPRLNAPDPESPGRGRTSPTGIECGERQAV